MLSEGLITSEEADKAVSFVSEFNDQLFNQYTEEYGRMRSDAYRFAWISATVATNEYDSRCEKIQQTKPVFLESTNGFIKNIKLLSADNRCLVLAERFN